GRGCPRQGAWARARGARGLLPRPQPVEVARDRGARRARGALLRAPGDSHDRRGSAGRRRSAGGLPPLVEFRPPGWSRRALLNGIFGALVAAAVLVAAFAGTMPATNDAALAAAKSAVEIALGLVGVMAMWLGFMNVLREAGIVRALARAGAPLLT